MQKKHVVAALVWAMSIVLPGLFLTSWAVTQNPLSLPWSPLIIAVLVLCATTYILIERGRQRVPPAPKVTPRSNAVPSPTSTFNTFGRSNTVRDTLAAVDRVARAKAEMDAANDDGDFPPEPTGEQIFGAAYRADKHTDGTWQVYVNGESRPVAKMTAITGGWTVIHSQAGYIGKFRNELQVFDALEQLR